MNIASILAKKGDKAYTVRPDQPIREALGLLAKHNVGALIAVDEAGHPVGIPSEPDLVRQAAKNERAFGLKLPDLLTRAGLTGSTHDELLPVAPTLTQRPIRH